ncbi:hypothetical protein PMZ80_008168 [Knufia obscura]|uniref:Uncharacterized protein n=1 Tax=Knufia obscura TaxID=1635080 RepID=A0ABR0RGN2_9EURO|nr:hypothetical protein PMZ80_008168 [Knufia obscura]
MNGLWDQGFRAERDLASLQSAAAHLERTSDSPCIVSAKFDIEYECERRTFLESEISYVITSQSYEVTARRCTWDHNRTYWRKGLLRPRFKEQGSKSTPMKTVLQQGTKYWAADGEDAEGTGHDEGVNCEDDDEDEVKSRILDVMFG